MCNSWMNTDMMYHSFTDTSNVHLCWLDRIKSLSDTEFQHYHKEWRIWFVFGCLYRDSRVWIMFVAANRLFSTTFIMSCYLYNYFVFILVEVVWNLSVCFCRQFIGSVASAAARPRCVEHLEEGRLVDVSWLKVYRCHMSVTQQNHSFTVCVCTRRIWCWYFTLSHTVASVFL